MSKTFPRRSNRRTVLPVVIGGLLIAALLTAAPVAPASAQTPGSTLVATHSGKCLMVEEGSTADGVKVVQADCDGADDQLFTVSTADGGPFQVIAVHSGKCLQVADGSSEYAARIVQGPCGEASGQQWELAAVAGGNRLTLAHSGLCLDVFGGSQAVGADAIQWPCHGHSNQVFGFEPIVAPPDPDLVGSTLVASHSGLCVEAPGAPGDLVQAVCAGGDDQLFTTADVGGGFVELVSASSGLCLHVKGASTAGGASIIEHACTGSQNSHWRLVPVAGGVRLEVRHTGFCLDVFGGSQAAGARLIQWSCHGGANQTFLFEPGDDRDPKPGSWSDVIDMPLVPVAAANLTNGSLLLWSAYDRYSFGGSRGYTQTAIYNPATGAISERQVSNTGHDMFCPGIANLPDGRILVSGGSGAAETSIYNPSTDSWEDAPDMQLGRGYQSNVALSDGSVFTVGGSWSGGVANKPAEVFRNGTWQMLPGVDPGASGMHTADARGLYRSDNHMWLFAWENGQVFHAGPGRNMHWVDTGGQGSVRSAGVRGGDGDAMNGNAVMYDVGQILTVGGAPNYDTDRGTANANVIDITGASVAVSPIQNLNHPRTLAHSVVLPSGEVVVVGGQGISRLFTDDEAVLIPELFDPVTRTWTELAPMTTPRTYHSVALLLQDGRVLTGGGGLCGNCAYNHADVEILTPPYLLDADGEPAPRPTITSAPTSAGYGTTMTVEVSGGASEFALVRLANSTHSVNNAQRRIPLSFTAAGGNRYSVEVPGSSGVAPPGSYMLFALDAAGVPSVATVVQLG